MARYANKLDHLAFTPGGFQVSFLTVREVAKRHGVPYHHMLALVHTGRIFPVSRLENGFWAIAPQYIILDKQMPKNGEKRGRGRPKGSRNILPYPTGVKRPRQSAGKK